MSVRLQPSTFRTSRRLDFVSEKELVAQTGHAREQWPLVALKELVDNAIDVCEAPAPRRRSTFLHAVEQGWDAVLRHMAEDDHKKAAS